MQFSKLVSQKLILITGMHRSGTSALAGLLVNAGFDPGQNLMSADEFNQSGYWEDWDIFNLNNQILSQLFLSWSELENLEERKIHLFSQLVAEEFAPVAKQLINQKFARSSNILIKDPRITILLPFWYSVLEATDAEIVHFHIYRHPLSVANSLHARNGFTIKNSLLLWYYYNMAFLNDCAHNPVIISYQKLINHDTDTIKKIVQKTGRDKLPGSVRSSLLSSLNHHPDDEKLEVAAFFPQVEGMWNLLNLAETHETIHDFKAGYNSLFIPKILNLKVEENHLPTVVNLVIENDGNIGNELLIFRGTTTGNGSVVFNLTNLMQPFSEFSIFPGDKPCRVRVGEVNISSDGRVFTVRPESGNYIFHSANVYFFNHNLPRLNYQLPAPCKPLKIEFFYESEPIKPGLDNVLIPALNFKNSELNKLNIDLEHQKVSLERQIQILISENTERIENLQRDNEISISAKELEISGLKKKSEIEKNTFEQKISILNQEIEGLERKSLWLYTEFNKLKDSVSWKMTTPVRAMERFVNKVGNKTHILINDVGASYRLLKREGVKYFAVRLIWYVKGKRLKEEIEYFKHRKFQAVPAAKPVNSETIRPLVFSESVNPRVSIIVPVFNNFLVTYRCLVSVLNNSGEIPYEIILADDCSDDNSFILYEMFKGVAILRNETNLGFLKTCNKVARSAKGAFICLLNNDTEVHEGWLQPLVDLLDTRDDIALVGPKMIYPDGRLQEAGGIIWNDASAWNYGRFDDAQKPDYNYLKEVDYVSGACLFIRKSVWEGLKGFDELFAPAYYEDTDLAMRVRYQGWKVFYQPLSVVTHYEGLSNGLDENQGVKKFQDINRRKFLDKWQKELSVEYSPNGNNVFFHRDRSLRQKHLLVIDHYVPMYDKDAGSRSTFSYLKLFVKMGFKIHFIGDNYFRHEPYTTVLQQMGIEVLCGDFYQKNIRDWFRENGRYIDFVIAHRIHIAPKYFDMIRKFTTAKIAYVGHDLQYLGSLRKFEVTADKKFKKESAKFLQAETGIFNAVDVILPFSTYEEPYIKKLAPEKTVQVIPVYFFDNIPEKVPGFDERRDILFVGYFGHPPNPDAILWFVKEVFPLVLQNIPDTRLHVVGSQPAKEVLGLQNDFIKVTGYVSDEELTHYYRTCKVAILPLRFGAGVKGKLLESLHHQIPTVITSVAAEGVPEIENYSLIADTSVDFAEKIRLLYQDKNVWEKYSVGGKELIEKHYTEGVAGKLLEKIFLFMENPKP